MVSTVTEDRFRPGLQQKVGSRPVARALEMILAKCRWEKPLAIRCYGPEFTCRAFPRFRLSQTKEPSRRIRMSYAPPYGSGGRSPVSIGTDLLAMRLLDPVQELLYLSYGENPSTLAQGKVLGNGGKVFLSTRSEPAVRSMILRLKHKERHNTFICNKSERLCCERTGRRIAEFLLCA